MDSSLPDINKSASIVFIANLFNTDFNTSHYAASNYRMISVQLTDKVSKKVVVAWFKGLSQQCSVGTEASVSKNSFGPRYEPWT